MSPRTRPAHQVNSRLADAKRLGVAENHELFRTRRRRRRDEVEVGASNVNRDELAQLLTFYGEQILGVGGRFACIAPGVAYYIVKQEGLILLLMSQDDPLVLEIVSGAASDLPPIAGVYRVVAGWRRGIRFGAPYTVDMPDGTTTALVEWAIPAPALRADNDGFADSYVYLAGMINLVGDTARRLAGQLIKEFGGRGFDGDDANEAVRLLQIYDLQ